MMHSLLIFLGLGVAAMTLAAILWSIAFPARRIWPPKRYTTLTPFLVWIPTFTLFGVLILLGVWGWGDLAIPSWVRFGVGLPLILIGNIVVWMEVSHFGVPQTGGTFRGAADRWSQRHPAHRRHVSLLAEPAVYG